MGNVGERPVKCIIYNLTDWVYNVKVVKRMWKYIKDNNLQDPKNKQMIKCDEKLSKVILRSNLLLGPFS